jgi:peptidoglycan/LPS O-acetylase OafA/YrhL
VRSTLTDFAAEQPGFVPEYLRSTTANPHRLAIPEAVSLPGRNRVFDCLRIVFALLVILSHTSEIPDGNRSRELFTRWFHTGMSFGSIGVDGFFLLSGYLILRSWLMDPHIGSYLQKRLLRIVPGYVVAVAVTILILGSLAPAASGFFDHLFGLGFFESVLILGAPVTPPLFPGLHWHVLNGSLWTITYEFACYLAVALLGACGLARRKYFWLALTVIFFVLYASPELGRYLVWHGHANLRALRLGTMFLVGGAYWHLRDVIPFRAYLSVIAAVLLISCFFSQSLAEPAVAVFGGYLLFFAGSRNLSVVAHLPKFPDISYGLYLYGWPVVCLIIWKLHSSPGTTFILSSTLAACLGWLSWHYVERPMLKWKQAPQRGAVSRGMPERRHATISAAPDRERSVSSCL